MLEEDAAVVLRYIENEAAISILKELPPNHGAAAVKSLPLLRTSHLISGKAISAGIRDQGFESKCSIFKQRVIVV